MTYKIYGPSIDTTTVEADTLDAAIDQYAESFDDDPDGLDLTGLRCTMHDTGLPVMGEMFARYKSNDGTVVNVEAIPD